VAISLPLIKLLAQRLFAEIENGFVFADFVETVHDFDGFGFFVKIEILPCLVEVIAPFLDLFAVILVYLLDAPHKIRGTNAILFFQHIFKFFIV
jgi:hypothetical protein